MAVPKVNTLKEDIEEILDGSIVDKGIKAEKIDKIQKYIDKTVREYMRIEIAIMLSTIYDNDDTQLEADLFRLEIFNPDGENICKTNKNKVGALNAVLPLIVHYFDDYDDLCKKVRYPYAEVGKIIQF